MDSPPHGNVEQREAWLRDAIQEAADEFKVVVDIKVTEYGLACMMPADVVEMPEEFAARVKELIQAFDESGNEDRGY